LQAVFLAPGLALAFGLAFAFGLAIGFGSQSRAEVVASLPQLLQ